MKGKKFISIIWGYSTHMYGFAPEENYHLHALKVAKELGYKPYVIIKGSRENMINDPHFDSGITVIEYQNFFQFLKEVLTFSFQGALFYVNSYEWQSFIIPFLAQKTIFMAHTQPKRQTQLKQTIQNFVYRFFSAIRLNNDEEKNFLLEQGVNPKKLHVVPLIVSQDVFKILDSNQERTDLVYFGNVTAKKDIPTIINAFELVKKTYPKIKLHIIGNIWNQNTQNRIDSSLHKKDIILHGFLPNETLVQELNKRLIYLNSSFDEGQCVAVYDAALSGCALCLPSIISFVGVFKDKALFHDVSNHNKLAQNIIYYLQNPNLIIQYRRTCIEMITEEYSIQKVESKLKDLFTLF
jgi:glycosyltransferase involved in cell wall biosynthesis